jgi:hypothetical protein
MPAERLSMRKVREVLRLKHACGASEWVIARSVGISPTAIGEYMRRAAVIGITWPVQQELDEAVLFAPAGNNPPRSKLLPEWEHIHAPPRCDAGAAVEEYPGHHPDGYGHGYSRFCDLYVEWRHGITETMRQTHTAPEKLFVDFAGDTLPVFDGLTGEVRAAKILAAVVGGIELHLRPSPVWRGIARPHQMRFAAAAQCLSPWVEWSRIARRGQGCPRRVRKFDLC